ncbi:MAG: rhodanese-like domain-containing protein [Alphaproteobacteria bacterium]|nr:rhodanese-like domain-containing protein [Alphaproteobacteria bacterium]
MKNLKTISATEFRDLHAAKSAAVIIDVRTGAEFEACHVEGAKLYPLQELAPTAILDASAGSEEPLYILCKAGGRAKKAAEQIVPHTDRDVIVVEGGTDACVACGVPFGGQGGEVMSIERQVRVVAGSLVVVGVALGTLVAPGFYLLSGFVGAGLVFAGLTDTCAMGMALARMPWNRAKAV